MHTDLDLPGVMTMALAEAAVAASLGEVPVGALVIRTDDGTIVSQAGNEREMRGDPTAHAEILALQMAAGEVESWRLSGHLLVVTLEPCPMCAGAALAARVDGVVFGAADPKAGSLGSLYNFASDPRLNHDMVVIGGVRADECAALLSSFFADRRSTRDL